jgi:hypothetical protein
MKYRLLTLMYFFVVFVSCYLATLVPKGIMTLTVYDVRIVFCLKIGVYVAVGLAFVVWFASDEKTFLTRKLWLVGYVPLALSFLRLLYLSLKCR